VNVLEPPVDSAEVARARELVRRRYGAALAEKASAAFLLAAVAPPSAAGTGGLEGVAPGAAPQTVLEFVPTTAPATAREVRRNASRAVLEALGSRAAPEVSRQVGPAARQLVLATYRDRFLADAGAIRSDCERAAAVLHRGPLEAAPGFEQPAFTDVCWLNQTMRIRSDPSTVADVASDPKVHGVDIPRPLEPELTATVKRVGATAWRKATGNGGKGVVVAVIDSEVAMQHPGLAGRVVQKTNYTREAFGNPGTHGTAVAGIIGSAGEVEGIAPEVTIYNYKVIASNPLLKGNSFDGSLAIQQALEDGAHVANCSWGNGPAGTGSSPEARACDTAWALGLTIVKSAGNRGPDARTLTTPADAAGVIVVGATDRSGKTIESYSSRGPTEGDVERPHLCAPGGSFDDGIVSALIQGGYGDCGAGTSFAAPHVAGLAALLLARDPTLDPDEVREALIDASKPLRGRFDGNAQGAGFVKLIAPKAKARRTPARAARGRPKR
jgi:serine protease AprX